MNLSQQTIELLAGVYDRLVEGCECGGSGKMRVGTPPCHDYKTCPTCRAWRELREEWTVHQWKGWDGKGHWNCSCGFTSIDLRNAKLHMHEYPQSPNLTTAPHGDIPLIVHWMQVLGIWDSFLHWHIKQVGICVYSEGIYLEINSAWIAHLASVAILITGTHRLEAVVSFLKERE